MLSTLKAKRATQIPQYTETKQGIFLFGGSVHDFHEWEFRTMSKYLGTKDEDKPALAGRIVEGLRDDVLTIAMSIGYEKLATTTGVAELVDAMRATVFPYKDLEAKELYRVGHEVNGMLSRQLGESMYAYINRRK